RILSEAKSLFAINADGSFVLGLIFFKMIEALKVKEIDQMIESLETQVGRPESVAFTPAPPKTPAAVTPEPAEKSAPETPAPEAAPAGTAEPAEATAPEPAPAAAPAPDPALAKFEQLCERIEDRNAELGSCFREQIAFVSYEDNALTWESCAEGDCRSKLKHGFPVIKQLVR
ncbi:MAG: DNA polymerase III subunit gamma/tau, partial [Campylobacterales bacterium]